MADDHGIIVTTKHALVASPLLEALGFASYMQACKANGHALLAKLGEKRGERGKREQ